MCNRVFILVEQSNERVAYVAIEEHLMQTDNNARYQHTNMHLVNVEHTVKPSTKSSLIFTSTCHYKYKIYALFNF